MKAVKINSATQAQINGASSTQTPNINNPDNKYISYKSAQALDKQKGSTKLDSTTFDNAWKEYFNTTNSIYASNNARDYGAWNDDHSTYASKTGNDIDYATNLGNSIYDFLRENDFETKDADGNTIRASDYFKRGRDEDQNNFSKIRESIDYETKSWEENPYGAKGVQKRDGSGWYQYTVEDAQKELKEAQAKLDAFDNTPALQIREKYGDRGSGALARRALQDSVDKAQEKLDAIAGDKDYSDKIGNYSKLSNSQMIEEGNKLDTIIATKDTGTEEMQEIQRQISALEKESTQLDQEIAQKYSNEKADRADEVVKEIAKLSEKYKELEEKNAEVIAQAEKDKAIFDDAKNAIYRLEYGEEYGTNWDWDVLYDDLQAENQEYRAGRGNRGRGVAEVIKHNEDVMAWLESSGLLEYTKALKTDLNELQSQIDAADAKVASLAASATVGEIKGAMQEYRDALAEKDELWAKRNYVTQVQTGELANGVKLNKDYEATYKKGKNTYLNEHSNIEGFEYDGNGFLTKGPSKLKGMTEDEVNAYFYLTEKDKETGEKMAKGYLYNMEETLNYRNGTKTAETISNWNNPTLRAIAKGGIAVAGGLDQFTQGTAQIIANTLYDGERVHASGVGATNQAVRQNIADKGTKVEQMAYDAITTTMNMLPSILVGEGLGALAGSVAMGLSAKGNAYNQAIQEGFTKAEAQTYSTIIGLSETCLQNAIGGISSLGGRFSLSNIAKSSIQNMSAGFARAALDLGMHGISEGTEEYLQDMLDPVFRYIATADENELKEFSWWTPEGAYSFALAIITTGVLEGAGGNIKAANMDPTGVGKNLVPYIQNNDNALIKYVAENTDGEIQELARDMLSGKAAINDANAGFIASVLSQTKQGMALLQSTIIDGTIHAPRKQVASLLAREENPVARQLSTSAMLLSTQNPGKSKQWALEQASLVWGLNGIGISPDATSGALKDSLRKIDLSNSTVIDLIKEQTGIVLPKGGSRENRYKIFEKAYLEYRTKLAEQAKVINGFDSTSRYQVMNIAEKAQKEPTLNYSAVVPKSQIKIAKEAETTGAPTTVSSEADVADAMNRINPVPEGAPASVEEAPAKPKKTPVSKKKKSTPKAELIVEEIKAEEPAKPRQTPVKSKNKKYKAEPKVEAESKAEKETVSGPPESSRHPKKSTKESTYFEKRLNKLRDGKELSENELLTMEDHYRYRVEVNGETEYQDALDEVRIALGDLKNISESNPARKTTKKKAEKTKKPNKKISVKVPEKPDGHVIVLEEWVGKKYPQWDRTKFGKIGKRVLDTFETVMKPVGNTGNYKGQFGPWVVNLIQNSNGTYSYSIVFSEDENAVKGVKKNKLSDWDDAATNISKDLAELEKKNRAYRQNRENIAGKMSVEEAAVVAGNKKVNQRSLTPKKGENFTKWEANTLANPDKAKNRDLLDAYARMSYRINVNGETELDDYIKSIKTEITKRGLELPSVAEAPVAQKTEAKAEPKKSEAKTEKADEKAEKKSGSKDGEKKAVTTKKSEEVPAKKEAEKNPLGFLQSSLHQEEGAKDARWFSSRLNKLEKISDEELEAMRDHYEYRVENNGEEDYEDALDMVDDEIESRELKAESELDNSEEVANNKKAKPEEQKPKAEKADAIKPKKKTNSKVNKSLQTTKETNYWREEFGPADDSYVGKKDGLTYTRESYINKGIEKFNRGKKSLTEASKMAEAERLNKEFDKRFEKEKNKAFPNAEKVVKPKTSKRGRKAKAFYDYWTELNNDPDPKFHLSGNADDHATKSYPTRQSWVNKGVALFLEKNPGATKEDIAREADSANMKYSQLVTNGIDPDYRRPSKSEAVVSKNETVPAKKQNEEKKAESTGGVDNGKRSENNLENAKADTKLGERTEKTSGGDSHFVPAGNGRFHLSAKNGERIVLNEVWKDESGKVVSKDAFLEFDDDAEIVSVPNSKIAKGFLKPKAKVYIIFANNTKLVSLNGKYSADASVSFETGEGIFVIIDKSNNDFGFTADNTEEHEFGHIAFLEKLGADRWDNPDKIINSTYFCSGVVEKICEKIAQEYYSINKSNKGAIKKASSIGKVKIQNDNYSDMGSVEDMSASSEDIFASLMSLYTDGKYVKKNYTNALESGATLEELVVALASNTLYNSKGLRALGYNDDADIIEPIEAILSEVNYQSIALEVMSENGMYKDTISNAADEFLKEAAREKARREEKANKEKEEASDSVDASFLITGSEARQNVDDLIKSFRNDGKIDNAELIKALNADGFNVSPDESIRISDDTVSAEEIARLRTQISKTGLIPINLKDYMLKYGLSEESVSSSMDDTYVYHMQNYARRRNESYNNLPDNQKTTIIDSQGNRLSTGQVEWFGNSRLVDKNGRLKLMFHGSKKLYERIDFGKMDDFISFFLTDTLQNSASYSGGNNVEDSTVPSKEYMDRMNNPKPIRELYENYEDDAEEILSDINFLLPEDKSTLPKKIRELYDSISQRLYSNPLNTDSKFAEDTENEIVDLLYAMMDEYGYDYSDMIDTANDAKSFREGILGSIGAYSGINSPMYANIQNPLVIDAGGKSWKMIKMTDEMIEAFQGGYKEEFAKFLEETNSKYSVDECVRNTNGIWYCNTRFVAKYAYDNGYDSMVINNVFDYGPNSPAVNRNEDRLASTICAVFKENAVKDASNFNPTDHVDFNKLATRGEEINIESTPVEAVSAMYKEGTPMYNMYNAMLNGDWNLANQAANEMVSWTKPNTTEKSIAKSALTKEAYNVVRKKNQDNVDRTGRLRPGENPSREVILPNADENGRLTRRFYQNWAESKGIPEYAAKEAERVVAEMKEGSYERISDKAALAYAERQLRQNDPDSLAGILEGKLQSGKIISKFDLATAESLMIQYANHGEINKALDMLAQTAEMATMAGQFIQGLRMMKKLDPVTQLYYLQRSVNALNRQYDNRIQREINKGKRQSEIAINESLAEQFVKAETTKDRNDVLDEIIQDLASQVPSTLKDKWNSWRYFSMLSSPRTHVRNIIGNAMFSPFVFMKNIVRSGLEFAAVKTGLMAQEERSMALFGREQYREFAKQAWTDYEKTIRGEAKYSITGRNVIEQNKKIWGKSKVMNALTETTGNLLELEDAAFLRPYFENALMGALSAQGIAPEALNLKENNAAVQRAITYAINEAQEATYRDASQIADGLNSIKKAPVLGIFMEGVVPFTKTPVNILARGVEYSPLMVIEMGVKTIKAMMGKGSYTGAEIINDVSKGMTGSAVALLGLFLAKAGILKGGDDDDKQKEFDNLKGYQSFSLNVPGTDINYTIDWAAPIALPLFTGVALYDVFAEDGNISAKDFETAIGLLSEPMLQLSMLDGLNNTLSSLSYANGDTMLSTLAKEMSTSYIGQAMPTIMGQIARTFFDDTRRASYVDKTSEVPEWIQYFIQSSVIGKIPIAESGKMAYVDNWGRLETQESTFRRFINNMISPGYSKRINVTQADTELQRLYDATGENVLPKKAEKTMTLANGESYYMTAEEYQSYAVDLGQTSLELITQAINSRGYRELNDDQKVYVISELYKYARDRAHLAVSQQAKTYDVYEEQYKEVSKLSNVPNYFISKKLLDSSYSTKPDERNYKALDNAIASLASLPESNRDVIDSIVSKNSLSRADDLLIARSIGLGSEQYFKYYDLRDGASVAPIYKLKPALLADVEAGIITKDQADILFDMISTSTNTLDTAKVTGPKEDSAATKAKKQAKKDRYQILFEASLG